MSRPKILPVSPEYPDTFWSYKYAVRNYTSKRAAMPPTGLVTALALVPEEKFEIGRVIDMNVEPLRDDMIRGADLIFTSSMIVQEDSHNQVILRAKKYGKPVVAGGPFPTSYPKRNDADHIVAGEAEVTLPYFLDDFLNNGAMEEYREEMFNGSDNLTKITGIELTKNGKVDIGNTPLPRWDLIDLSKYVSAAVQYSRGCPFDCDFCDITKLFGRESRTKSPDQMVRELDHLYNNGFRGDVFIVDDNFIGNRKSAREMLPAIGDWQKKMGRPFRFYTEADVGLAWDNNRKLLDDMVNTGFYQVFLGIESPDEDVIDMMNKKQNKKMKPIDVVRRIQNAGLEVMSGFIIGSDGDKPDVFDRMYEFIQESGIPVAMVGLLTALKNTNLYKRLDMEGRLREESNGNNTHSLGFNFEPLLDEGFLIEGYKDLLGKLFSAKSFYERCAVSRDNLGRQNVGNNFNWEKLMGVGVSVKRNLFRKDGLDYAKYVFDSLIKRPSYISTVIGHSAKLDHFREITRETLAETS